MRTVINVERGVPRCMCEVRPRGVGSKHMYGVYAVFFFFQAEDGIRDVAVTGVQTCLFRSGPRTLTVQKQCARERRWPQLIAFLRRGESHSSEMPPDGSDPVLIGCRRCDRDLPNLGWPSDRKSVV